jgi:hypothetical protein
MQPTRRGFLAGLGALFAAPAIVRIESLMPVRALILPTLLPGSYFPRNDYLTLQQITREAVRTWKNSNAFIASLDQQYDEMFARHLVAQVAKGLTG